MMRALLWVLGGVTGVLLIILALPAETMELSVDSSEYRPEVTGAAVVCCSFEIGDEEKQCASLDSECSSCRSVCDNV